MKPCRRHQKSLALLAASALETETAAEVRAHLAQCPACQEHFKAMESLCHAHVEGGQSLPRAELAPHFYSRLSCRIRQCERSQWPGLLGARSAWRIRLAAALALLVLLASLLLVMRRSSQPGEVAVQRDLPTTSAESGAATEPKLITYRLAANRSLEDLDELLARDARKPIPIPSAHRAGDALLDVGL
jgi:anti-sigma factor RsiW